MYRIELTLFHAGSAFDAYLLIDLVHLFLFSIDGVGGTHPFACHASNTILLGNHIIEQAATLAGTTFFFIHVFMVLLHEIIQRGEYRVW